MRSARSYLSGGLRILLVAAIALTGVAAESPLCAQQSTPPRRPKRFAYVMSLAGGVAIGVAAGALIGGRDSIGKGAFLGSGVTSALYLHTRYQNPPDSTEYLTTYTLLGTGAGWTLLNSEKGATIGGLTGFGASALWLSRQYPNNGSPGGHPYEK